MHQSNPSRPHISLRFGSILPAMFRSMPIWTILTIGISDALSQQTVVVDPSKEKKAWTITWSEGPVSLTQVWIETTQDTCWLGTFPGESRGLEWNPAGDRLYYSEKPLETKMIGIPLMERRSSPLSPTRVWELPVDQGSIRISQESSASVSGGGTTTAYNTVSYTVTPEDTPGIAGFISSLFRWREGKREEFYVTYEQPGTAAQEAEYVELELENRQPGKYLLKVTVKDRNSSETVEKDAGFVIAKPD